MGLFSVITMVLLFYVFKNKNVWEILKASNDTMLVFEFRILVCDVYEALIRISFL